jgi:hypothetical protein
MCRLRMSLRGLIEGESFIRQFRVSMCFRRKSGLQISFLFSLISTSTIFIFLRNRAVESGVGGQELDGKSARQRGRLSPNVTESGTFLSAASYRIPVVCRHRTPLFPRECSEIPRLYTPTSQTLRASWRVVESTCGTPDGGSRRGARVEYSAVRKGDPCSRPARRQCSC